MASETDNLVLKHLPDIRGSLDRVEQRFDDLTVRVGRIETNIAQIYVALAEHSVRFDHLETRITRIEKRLDLAEAE